MCELKMLLLMSPQHNVHTKHVSSYVSVLPSIAQLSPALMLYLYFVCLCPSILLKLGLLWIGFYEFCWLYSLLNPLN